AQQVHYQRRYLRPRLYSLETVFVRSQVFLKIVVLGCLETRVFYNNCKVAASVNVILK
ncbi:MAG: hypothetical protein ACI8ZA_002766, partial [Gammaproteobacteria bacterium]